MTLLHSQDMFQSAQDLFEKGLSESAYKLTQLLLSNLSHSREPSKQQLKADALLLLGDIFYSTKETNRALDCFEKCRNLFGKKIHPSKHFELCFKISKCFYEIRLYRNAVIEMEKIPELERTVFMWTLLATMHELLQDIPSAIYCYKVLLDQNPCAIAVLIRLFELGVEKQDIDLILKGRLPDVFYHLYDSLDHQQKYDYKQEMMALKESQKKFGNQTWLVYRLAYCHFNLGNVLESYKMFKKLLTLDPKAVEYMDMYSLVLYQASKVTELEGLANRVSKDGPQRKETWCVLARLEFLNKEYESANTLIAKALELDECYSEGHILAGSIYFQQQQYDKAIQHYRKANLLSNDIRSLEGVLEAYLISNQTTSALELCSRVFRRAHVPRTMTLMAIVIAHVPEKQKESKKLLKTVLSLHPHCFEAAMAYSNLLASEKLHQEAIEILESQLAFQPSDFVYTCIGRLCIANNEPSKAMDYFNTALSMNAECVAAQEGLEKVDKLINGNDEEEDMQGNEEDESMNEESMEEL